MPFRIDENRTKIQFITSAEMPALIGRACVETETVSNTVYIQRAVCEALARDLGIPLSRLLEQLPDPRTKAKALFGVARELQLESGR